MPSLKDYIQAARLRTLPLSVSGIIVGTAIAIGEGKFHASILILAILTTIGFQVLSNFANDYGDGIKGTDDEREGELRLVASGKITPKQMKKAMTVTIFITLIIALLLIYISFPDNFYKALLFFALGIASIIAAVKYTVGSNAYGYSGLGDVFVFLFFGWLSVIGSYYLYSQELNSCYILLPASAIGMLSAAVLNLNNMRDQIQDKKAGKNTLVVKLGSKKAKNYHYFLILGSLLCLTTYLYKQESLLTNSWIFLAYIPLVKNIIVVAKNILFKDLDTELKKVALSTFLLSILFLISKLVG
ncbi:1,4-dihydroxy-2-naphthoate octaprenyltransferase [Pseudofulvibacter geojedonensis]|uniref:1,4-dihydroxy-2-naphthoate octaprenyltransferase n=1 Tax=Pseudofulvibacter geojedonensis TaxID=1123758 RepID=A0ABW3I322_9FLAO